jgi:hypothetical protein
VFFFKKVSFNHTFWYNNDSKKGDTMKKWLKENIFVKDMFIYILLAAIIFYIPAWVSVLIGLANNNPLLIGFGSAYVLLWAGPFTPTIPAIFAIAVLLKQLVKLVKHEKEDDYQ